MYNPDNSARGWRILYEPHNYLSMETLGISVVDEKVDKSKGESTAHFIRFWKKEPHRSMARIK